MAAPSTFRRDVVAGLVTILTAQKAATPSLLRGVWAARPGNFNELPLAYVGTRDETVTWDAGTWTRKLDGLTIVLVDSYADAAQTDDRLDQLVDALLSRLNDATSSTVAKAIIEANAVNDTELSVEGGNGQTTYYRAVVITLSNTAKREARD